MLQIAFDFGRDLSPRRWWSEYSERLFIGVRPETDVASHIDRFGREFCSKNNIAGRPRGRLHISLHSAGDHTHLPSRIIYAARLAGKAVSMPPVEVTLHSITSFENKDDPSRRPLVLLAESLGLKDLHGVLVSELRKVGLRARKRFNPHVTLLYGPSLVSEQRIEPIRFVVREFCLIHSELGRSRYNVLDRWPLIG